MIICPTNFSALMTLEICVCVGGGAHVLQTCFVKFWIAMKFNLSSDMKTLFSKLGQWPES